MPEREHPASDPERLHQLKNELLNRWNQLPAEHQASIALVLLEDVLRDEMGTWLVDALRLHATGTLGQVPVGELGGVRLAKMDRERLDQIRGMVLLPDDLREQLPPLYANEEQGLDARALVKYFTPDAGWTWYASEFDGEDLFFGLVSGLEVELGYFSLSELAEVQGPRGLPIERDLYYQPKTLGELKEMHERERYQE